jgi:hypothetical protein
VKSLIALAAVAAVAAVAAPASAQSLPALGPVTYNASAGYTGITWTGNNLGAVSLRAGADFGQYVGVEGEGSFGVADAGLSAAGVSAKLHLNDEYAAYGVVRYPVLANANLFARLGYGHIDAKASASAGAVSTSATDGVDSLNYGFGGQYVFDGKNGMRLEYTRFDVRGHDAKAADSWSLSYVRKF